jgi:cobalt-zinc-cadmium efflux system outer membrane protein
MPRPGAALALIPLAGVVGGCAPGPLDDSAWPESRPLGGDLQAYRPPRSADEPPASASAFEEPTGTLSLRTALASALLRSPDLAAASYEVRAREAEILQAGQPPNPELELELENFGGSGELAGFDGAETTLWLGQLVELGGKRVKRRRVAELEARSAGWAYEMRRVDVLSRTAADFIAVLAAQRRRELAIEIAELAQRVHDAVGERVDAGKVSPVERAKTQVELAQARLAQERAERTLAAARVRLASNWGSVEPRFAELSGILDRVDAPPSFEAILAQVERSPDVARWAAEAALRQAELELAMAQRVPDLAAAGGVRYLGEIDETVLVAGISMDIPVFDRNQGGIQAARLRSLQGDRLEEAARVRTRTAVAEVHQLLATAFVEVRTIRDDVLPSAELAFGAAEEAFRQGKIGSLDLLDAERTLSDARRQLVDALTSYHLAGVAAERLIGAPIRGNEQSKGG